MGADRQPAMTGPASWTVVLAIKPLHDGKSRLSPQLAAGQRRDLVGAMARDVVSAVVGTTGVVRCLVVTADVEGFAPLQGLGAELLPEPAPAGLNAAYRAALGRLGEGPVALLAADLPALTSGELGRALDLTTAAAGSGASMVSMVSDRQGSGTTMLAATAAALLTPRFGPDSRRRHVDGGAVDLGPWCGDGLRRDIDTFDDLSDLAESGTAGAATSAWLTAPSARRPA